MSVSYVLLIFSEYTKACKTNSLVLVNKYLVMFGSVGCTICYVCHVS